MKRFLFGLMLSLVVGGCAHARHIAVVADASFAQSVFALDDAELQACQQSILTPAQCAMANPKIKQALLDVVAVTKAIQATPNSVAMPAKLPDLLKDLTDAQAILAAASGLPQAAVVVGKAQNAVDQAIAVLKLYAQFSGTGGQ